MDWWKTITGLNDVLADFFVKFDMFDMWSELILSYFALVYIKYTFEFPCMVVIIKYINMTADVYDQAHTSSKTAQF